MYDNGNVNWCMLGRAFLCRTGHFCVEPAIFVSKWAFLCRTNVIIDDTQESGLINYPMSILYIPETYGT